MTDTGRVPGEGQPENAGMVEQPGVPAPDSYTYLSESSAEDEDLLLPGAQGAWGNEIAPPAPEPVVETVHEPGPHETGGRDTGSVDLGGVRLPEPGQPQAPGPAVTHESQAPAAPRRPLHLGPPIPSTTAGPVRSLADRGPADVPVRQVGPPTVGPEYLDVPRTRETAPQPAQPWGARATVGATVRTETVAPPQQSMGAAQALVARVATEAGAGQPQNPPQPAVAAADLQSSAVGPEGSSVPTAEATGSDSGPGTGPGSGADPAAGGIAGPPEDPGHEAGPAADAVPSLVPDAGRSAETVPAPTAGAQEQEQEQEPEEVQAPEADAAPVLGTAPEAPAREAVAAPVPEGVTATGGSDPASVAAHEPQGPFTGPADPQAAPAVALSDGDAEAPAPAAPDALSESGAPAEPDALAEPEAPADEAQAPEAAVFRTPEHAEAPEPVVPAPEAATTPDTEPALDTEPAPDTEPALDTEPAPETGSVPVAAAEPVAEEASGQYVLAEHPVQGPQQTPAAPSAPPAQEAWTPLPVPPAPSGTEAPATDPAVPAAPVPPPDGTATPLPGSVPPAVVPDRTPKESDPVEGVVPAVPHLAPTPPQPLNLPTEEQPEQPGPEATGPVPAPPRAGTGDVPAAPAPEPAAEPPAQQGLAENTPAEHPPAETEPTQPVLAQDPDDLATRGAGAPDAAPPAGPAAPGYDDAERAAVQKVMRERRDIRNGFRDDPIPHEVLLRVLEAAHTAPSVGHSQPWDFVVIRSAETRRSMHELAERQRDAYAQSLPKGRAKQFKELKIEAILDTPVNIVVTADPTRGGRHTLGRHTQPQMAPYSSALAVQNLWLAARAEGLGVGWVSFFDEREMVRSLGLPEHLEVVAYLCVGYVDEFPAEPELMQAGWSKRRPLSWVVHEETYGRRVLPGEEPHDLLAETVAQIRPLDAKALGEAWERQKRMTKPAGALGMLEIISAQLSGLSRQCPPPIPEPAAVAVFAGDHGVHAQGVTPWPQEVTAQMVANFLGGGAVCNAFATQVGAEVCVVDVGVASDLPATPGLLPRKVRAGTSDMTAGPAMTREEVKQAIEVGIETARDLVAAGNKALLTGEMGIANTTASAALISVFTGVDPGEVTGRGTGINDETLARKTDVVRRALELHQPDPADPVGVLAAVGGFEHAAMVGLLLGGASLRTPVILDGVSAGAAALVARAIAPEVLAACIAGHRSAEPGHVAALNKLGLRPLVDLDLRLGEGTGALLALPMVQSTARAMHEVATFDSAGVTEK
ncbi:nicotinate-nucleotide--dimethylbenzimidazole phosphoribosyltransferase [Streptomyces sp. NEAU-W12]|uniref:nicotinate-nucleotide--dimethylbenzimidazole phosphoribosyltransferase n=1 Tax=Streptomyces sp. NEAU-W12 TaxID=2994668 RepID=UPI00224AB1D4|nr:nicotinate-nucleotide--dimethylbenzimidazole phosphoribosyltransferase [Streptomyces sp. NEAU-W12]MCX2925941.1 nicotinate-nucleotide--dimethylbenzimidazole phosphoribosyltransferase [Streptomyces sp. NEAU-W12]